MKRNFKIEKLPLDTLISSLIALYESGIDFVDLTSDNSDPIQDKLVIFTKDEYINPDFYSEERLTKFQQDMEEEEDDTPKRPSIIETKKLSDDDIDKLL